MRRRWSFGCAEPSHRHRLAGGASRWRGEAEPRSRVEVIQQIRHACGRRASRSRASLEVGSDLATAVTGSGQRPGANPEATPTPCTSGNFCGRALPPLAGGPYGREAILPQVREREPQIPYRRAVSQRTGGATYGLHCFWLSLRPPDCYSHNQRSPYADPHLAWIAEPPIDQPLGRSW